MVELTTGLKGETGVSITDFVLNEDGTATTTFNNGEKRETKLTSFVKAKEEADKAQNSAEAAYTSMVAAQGSEQKASVSEVNAKSSEQASKLSETNARKSEESSASSAATATEQASSARTSASNASVSEANSKASEKAASVSASNAKASADTASTQASASASSATSAKNSATSASQSASSASSSASSASNSASSAASSDASASDSRDKASEYKTSASGSATAAASSASSASTSATNAKAAMNTANTAASSASTSAINASTSASNASKSEVAAKSAQAEAERARDEANSALAKISGALKYMGQVDNYNDLPSTGNSKGDTWNVVNADPSHHIKAGDNVAWNGIEWDDLSGVVDLSAYAEKADYQKAITSATANGATITFNHKDGTTSTATVNNVASSTSATNDAKGQKIDTTYEKISDASNVHASLQNSINTKQDKLAFDTTPTANSFNPVTSGGIKTALDTKLDKTGGTVTGAIIAPYFITGVGKNTYVQFMKFRGEGDANDYVHAIDFGYGGHNQVDFYEYGGIWNFWHNTAPTKGGTLVGSIKPSGWNGNVVGNVTGNADTATKLQTARTINFNGALDGNVTFDGSKNVSVTLLEFNHTEAIIDLTDATKYDTDTYYPVVSNAYWADVEHKYRCWTPIHTVNTAPWGTFNGKTGDYSAELKVRDTMNGWGSRSSYAEILTNSCTYTNKMPITYSQMRTCGRSVFFVRGGGKYFVSSTRNATWELKTGTFTENKDTVAPTKTYFTPESKNTIKTVGINISGNANTASSVAWRGVTGKPSDIIKVASWDGSTLSLTTAT